METVSYDLTGNVIYPIAQAANEEADEAQLAMAELPFENKYYLLSILKEKGLPDYLQIREDKLMFLK